MEGKFTPFTPLPHHPNMAHVKNGYVKLYQHVVANEPSLFLQRKYLLHLCLNIEKNMRRWFLFVTVYLVFRPIHFNR